MCYIWFRNHSNKFLFLIIELAEVLLRFLVCVYCHQAFTVHNSFARSHGLHMSSWTLSSELWKRRNNEWHKNRLRTCLMFWSALVLPVIIAKNFQAQRPIWFRSRVSYTVYNTVILSFMKEWATCIIAVLKLLTQIMEMYFLYLNIFTTTRVNVDCTRGIYVKGELNFIRMELQPTFMPC